MRGAGDGAGTHGNAEEHQGHRRHHARAPRFLDSVLLSGRQPEADRLRDGHLLQDRRRREKGAQARQARGQAHSGDVGDAHSVAGQRHHRPRMRLDHQQCRAAEADRLHQHPLPDREPLRFQEVEQDQLDRRSQGQAGGLHVGYHQHQAAHRGQCRKRPERQYHPGQGSCRSLPDGGDRPRRGLRDGRHSAGEPGCRLEGAWRLRHLERCVLQARALWHHAAQGRPGLQEGGRCGDRGALYGRRGPEDLRQVVYPEDSAEGPEPQCADRRKAEERVRQAVGFAGSDSYK